MTTNNIVDRIETKIEQFSELNDGRQPEKIILGRKTHLELKRFASRYSSDKPLSGTPNYNGIPIVEIDEENHISFDNLD